MMKKNNQMLIMGLVLTGLFNYQLQSRVEAVTNAPLATVAIQAAKTAPAVPVKRRHNKAAQPTKTSFLRRLTKVGLGLLACKVAYNLGDVSGPTGRLPARECCEQMIAESLIAKQAAKHHQPACTNALHRLQPFYTAQHPYHSPTQRLHGARRAVTPRRRHSAPQCSRIARWLAWIAQMIATMTTIISPSTATAYRRDGLQRMRARR